MQATSYAYPNFLLIPTQVATQAASRPPDGLQGLTTNLTNGTNPPMPVITGRQSR